MYAWTVLLMYVLLRMTLAVNEQAYLAVRPPLRGGASVDDEDVRTAVAFRLPWRVRRLLEALDAEQPS